MSASLIPGTRAAVGNIDCRYTAKSPALVTYYTCKKLADIYGITIPFFFFLNPGLKEDCSNVQPLTEYCVRGWVCYSGACVGRGYTVDGKCGTQHDNLKCGGRWGDCCSFDGVCGTGPDFCGKGKCQSGNCTSPERPKPPSSEFPWQVGTTPDGTCGGEHGYTCDVVFGTCCGNSGVCGSTELECGAGCQPQFGRCKGSEPPPTTTSAPQPTGTSSHAYAPLYPYGCYALPSGGEILNGDTLVDRSMTPKLCSSYCIDEKRYSLFAIRSVGCLCGNELPPSSAPMRGGCGLECSGDAKETCGGKSAVSVFGKSQDWFADDFDDGTMSRWTKRGGSFDASSKSLVAGHAWGSKALVKDHEFSDSTLEVDVSLSRDHTGDAGVIFRASSITSGIDGYTGYYAGITSSGRVVLGRANNGWKEIRSRLVGIDRGRAYRLKVVATGPSISVFVDDMKTPRIVARDETHARGRTGVRVFNTGATFDSVRIVPPPVQPITIEEFAGDKLSPSWTTYGGSFTVSDRSLVAGKSYGGKAVLNVTASDFELDVFVRLADKSGDAGLIFRVNDAAVGGDSLRSYYVGITGSSRRVLLGMIDYAWKQIGEARLDGRASGSYALGVRADGKSISVSVDDEVKIKVDDDSFVGGGAVGVRVYDTGAAFSDFRLIRL